MATVMRPLNVFRVKWFASDGARELGAGQANADSEVRAWFDENCIGRWFSAPRAQWQNGKIERNHRTCTAMMMANLIRSGAPKKFWHLAREDAAYKMNFLSNPSACKAMGKSEACAIEALTGVKPSVEHMRVWGCRAYVLNEKEIQKGTLAPRATPGVMVGYGFQHGYKAYLVYDPSTRKIRISTNVLFVEDEFPLASVKDREDISSLSRIQAEGLGPRLTVADVGEMLGMDGDNLPQEDITEITSLLNEGRVIERIEIKVLCSCVQTQGGRANPSDLGWLKVA